MPSLALQIKSKQVEEAKKGEEGVRVNLGRKGNSHSSGKFLCLSSYFSQVCLCDTLVAFAGWTLVIM